jgi:hypothetical protein
MGVAVCCSEQSLKMAALNTGLVEKLTVSQLVKKFPEFMETECSLPPSQQPTISPLSPPSRPHGFEIFAVPSDVHLNSEEVSLDQLQ